MKKYFLSLIFVLFSAVLWAWNSPVTIPDVGNARLHVVAQNAENYLDNLDASNSSCSTQAEFDAKTLKIANVFIALDADIVAICEVQANNQILGYLVNKMNELAGSNDYSYISDNINVSNSGTGYQSLKAGYIYRSTKVTPVGNNTSPYYSGEYYRRMRIQAFQENLTEEKFVLSMNHFKAKSGSADQGESTRIQNASELIDALQYITVDPDILIMGDLNAYMGETPIENLEAAGFEEQLTVYDPDAYTYNYYGDLGILDHCMANESMAAQITGAYAYHINTGTRNKNSQNYTTYHYSDHDAVLVGINLGGALPDPDGFDHIDTTLPAQKIIRNGQIYIVIDNQLFTILGTKVQ